MSVDRHADYKMIPSGALRHELEHTLHFGYLPLPRMNSAADNAINVLADGADTEHEWVPLGVLADTVVRDRAGGPQIVAVVVKGSTDVLLPTDVDRGYIPDLFCSGSKFQIASNGAMLDSWLYRRSYNNRFIDGVGGGDPEGVTWTMSITSLIGPTSNVKSGGDSKDERIFAYVN